MLCCQEVTGATLSLFAHVQATAEAAALRREVAAARADNVALVERLRFVQGYAQQQRTRKGALALFCSSAHTG